MASAAPAPKLERDPVKIDPLHYNVELENEQMRVVRIKYRAHEKSPKFVNLFDIPSDIRHPDDMVEFLVGLDCEQDYCESQILVFAPMESDIDSVAAKARIQEWSRADLTCRQGHPVRHPYQLLSLRTF